MPATGLAEHILRSEPGEESSSLAICEHARVRAYGHRGVARSVFYLSLKFTSNMHDLWFANQSWSPFVNMRVQSSNMYNPHRTRPHEAQDWTFTYMLSSHVFKCLAPCRRNLIPFAAIGSFKDLIKCMSSMMARALASVCF